MGYLQLEKRKESRAGDGFLAPCEMHRSPLKKVPLFISTYRARWLFPRFSVDLHGKVLLGLDDDGRALGKTLPRRPQTGPNLTHVKAILEADNLDELVANVWRESNKIVLVLISN